MNGASVRRFWDVEGVPVLEVKTPDGGGGFRALEAPEPRPFPWGSVSRNGAVVAEDRFNELFPDAAAFIPAALASFEDGSLT